MTSNRSEIEKTILGAWILGYHMKDMDKVTVQDFANFPEVYEGVRKCGADIYAVSKETGVKIAELAKMTQLYQKEFYRQAIAQVYDAKAREYLVGVTSDTPLTEVIGVLESYSEKETVVSLPTPAKDLAVNYFEELDRRAKQEVINTGLTDIDHILCGIRPKELTTIGARPSVGKSAFALQVAVDVAKQGKKVLYFPLEMSTTQTVERMMLRYIDIPQRKLKRGDVDWALISKASERIAKLEKTENFLIFEAVNDIEVIKELVRKHKPYLIVIDQLEQMRSSKEKFRDKRERFSYMTNSLKRLSMTDDVAVWLAAQVNRDARNSPPKLSNLKESGSIEEDSDNVILIHRIPIEDMTTDGWDDNNRPMLINIAKQRQGATGEITCKFIASKFTFYGIA